MDPNLNNQTRSERSLVRRMTQITAYWFQLIIQPLLAVAFVIGLAWLFGYLQRNHNWFNNSQPEISRDATEADAQYACSMLCVFVGAPGRCPVCGMELQKIETTGDPKDIYGVTIDPTSRRLAKIRTVAALNMPVSKTTESLGRVSYDETSEATVAAYVDGRIEDLLVDYRGARIREGDQLAVLYSPGLYADQVGLFEARKALETKSTNQRVNEANRRLYQSARQRLIEQGLSESQVNSIESSGSANNRIQITAPMSGTVVEKLVDRGKYVKTGMPLFKIADLSTVWLLLEMYPKATTNLRIGQSVSVEIQSQTGEAFQGKISFISPIVDPVKQTVNVRVAIPNEAGLIKVGDFGKAIIRSTNSINNSMVVVPRESVLTNGNNSIAYVETEPGRFEFRQVKIVEFLGDQIAVSEGIQPGEQVVAAGAFMLDSTFNIQGKVSLIDPSRADLKNESRLAKAKAEAREIEASFKDLSPQDRKLAEAQVICPVSEVRLGTHGMGTPITVNLEGTPVMICCEGCRQRLLETPEQYMKVLKSYRLEKNPQPTDANHSNDMSPTDLLQYEMNKAKNKMLETPR